MIIKKLIIDSKNNFPNYDKEHKLINYPLYCDGELPELNSTNILHKKEKFTLNTKTRPWIIDIDKQNKYKYDSKKRHRIIKGRKKVLIFLKRFTVIYYTI